MSDFIANNKDAVFTKLESRAIDLAIENEHGMISPKVWKTVLTLISEAERKARVETVREIKKQFIKKCSVYPLSSKMLVLDETVEEIISSNTTDSAKDVK